MALKWKTLIDEHDPLPNNVFYFTTSYTKTLEDGSTKNYSFTVDIPDLFAKIHCGNKKVSKVIKDMYEANPIPFLTTGLPLVVQTVADNFKYQIGALIESNSLYFNPLWNVDGTEKITEDRAKRERNTEDKYGDGVAYTTSVQYGQDTNTMKYGNNTSYTEQMQYGLDETTHTNGARTETTDHKTNPFNDSDTLYNTSEDVLGTVQYDDKDSRAIHTDTATYNPHTDVSERSQHTDTTTINPHIDKGHIEDLAFKDVITHERHGNIGVTKSTELLRDYRELPTELHAPILDLLMKYLSRGY